MGESRISGLEELLRTRVPNVRLGIHGRPRNPVVPTGVAPLDALLGGGLAGGDLTELVGEGPVSGSAQVLHAFLRSLARAGRFMALIDGADSLDIDAPPEPPMGGPPGLPGAPPGEPPMPPEQPPAPPQDVPQVPPEMSP